MNRRLSIVLVRAALGCLLLAPASLAQGGSSEAAEKLREAAGAAWSARDWPAAAKALEELVSVQATDGEAWYRLGYALHAQGKLDAALRAHVRASKSGSKAPTAAFNAACVHALQGRKEVAFEWLHKAAAMGFTEWRHAESDADLQELREDPRFPKLVLEMKKSAARSQRTVAIFVHDGVELLDFAGPGEVFAIARGSKGERFRVVTVSGSKKPVVSQRFLKIVPEFTFTDCPQPDIVVLPGGSTRRALQDPGLVSWVKRVTPKAEIVMSVCTGALILGKAGLLEGQEATTHFGALKALTRAVPNAKIRRDLRIVDNGKIVTTAGISAGMDGALHVVSRLLGEDAAKTCADHMEYRWVRDHFRGKGIGR